MLTNLNELSTNLADLSDRFGSQTVASANSQIIFRVLLIECTDGFEENHHVTEQHGFTVADPLPPDVIEIDLQLLIVLGGSGSLVAREEDDDGFYLLYHYIATG